MARKGMTPDSENINWFPGHMAKTRREITESLKKVDGVVIMLDARIPESSKNPEIDSLTSGKRRMFIFNKADLADENATSKWIELYTSRGDFAMKTDSRRSSWKKEFLNLANKMLFDVKRNNEERGMPGKPLRLMIVGIPNTGKSSFINRIVGKNKAKAEDRPGVTRQGAWYSAGDGVELYDTPGVLWPKFDDVSVGEKLAFTGGIKDNVLDCETIANKFIEIMVQSYPDRLTYRYRVSERDMEMLSSWEIIEMIGKRRGLILKGGEVNTLGVSLLILDEFRSGRLGKLTFEWP